MGIENIYSEQELQALKDGQTIAKSLKDTGTSLTNTSTSIFTELPSVSSSFDGPSPDIRNRTEKVVKPTIRDNHGNPIHQAAVSQVNIDRHNKAAAKRLLDV